MAEALIDAFVWRLSVWHLSVSLSVTFCYNLRSPPSCVLALTLLVAINYVLGHLTWYVRVTISRHNFSDVAYTVDAAIFLSDESQATETSIHSALPLLRWVSGYLGPRPNLRICYKQSVSHSYHGPCDCWCCEGIHISAATNAQMITLILTCYKRQKWPNSAVSSCRKQTRDLTEDK